MKRTRIFTQAEKDYLRDNYRKRSLLGLAMDIEKKFGIFREPSQLRNFMQRNREDFPLPGDRQYKKRKKMKKRDGRFKAIIKRQHDQERFVSPLDEKFNKVLSTNWKEL